ncbi:MAG TPA: sialidase family protein [Chitinophagales bacterium]|nr:sialidase family protein [Chitinophagales bacterium]
MYRIPALVKTNSGRLLAFCEGRQSLFDHGDIDLVLKTSDDGGHTWSKLQLVWNYGKHTCGNPVPVVDAATGNVIVVATLDNDSVFVLRSADEGKTWSAPQNITASVKPANWQWYATGPVHGIQLKQAPYTNRLVVPCNHTVAGGSAHISHAIYSDDGGANWVLGQGVMPEGTDECTVIELTTGELMLNMRTNGRTQPFRKKTMSSDGGKTWTSAKYEPLLPEPVCQGSLLRYSFSPGAILFLNPAHKTQRKSLTLSISYSEGKAWERSVSVNKGKSAYSDMAVLNNGALLCVYETGKILPYSGIVFQSIPIDSILPPTP